MIILVHSFVLVYEDIFMFFGKKNDLDKIEKEFPKNVHEPYYTQ